MAAIDVSRLFNGKKKIYQVAGDLGVATYMFIGVIILNDFCDVDGFVKSAFWFLPDQKK